LELHPGEERHQRMASQGDDRVHVEIGQRFVLPRRELEVVGIGIGVGEVFFALVLARTRNP
jgi:hypothetical protein